MKCTKIKSGLFHRLSLQKSVVQISAIRWKSTEAPATNIWIGQEYNMELDTFEDKEWKNALPFKKVPGPKALPIIGNSWRFLPFIGDFQLSRLDQMLLHMYKEFGPCAKISNILGRPDILFIADPDDIEKVFRNEDQHPHRPSMPSLMYYKNVLRKDFFENSEGVLSVQGETWSNFRSKVQQAMLQPRTAKMYVGAIEEAANALVERQRSIKDCNGEMPHDFINELNKWSLESIASIALDTRLGCLDPHPPEDTQRLINAISSFFVNVRSLELRPPLWKLVSTPTWKKYINALDTIYNISLHHIKIAMEKNGEENQDNRREMSLLQRLLTSNTNNPQVAVVMALEMFIVGIDTVSTAVASTLYQLSQHQDIQEKLYREISSVLPTPDSTITPAKLESMHYLKACIKENFRMYPTVLMNARHLSKNTVIHGYQIPKGTMVIFQNYVACNLEKNFENCDSFYPERWLKNSNKKESNNGEDEIRSIKSECPHHAFASLPFGYGKRMCLGKRFADLEMQTVICKMVHAFKVEYRYKSLEYHMMPMFTPNGPLRFKLTNRY